MFSRPVPGTSLQLKEVRIESKDSNNSLVELGWEESGSRKSERRNKRNPRKPKGEIRLFSSDPDSQGIAETSTFPEAVRGGSLAEGGGYSLQLGGYIKIASRKSSFWSLREDEKHFRFVACEQRWSGGEMLRQILCGLICPSHFLWKVDKSWT